MKTWDALLAKRDEINAEIKKRLDERHERCERWHTQLQEWQKSLETRETNLIGRLLDEEEKLKQGGVVKE